MISSAMTFTIGSMLFCVAYCCCTALTVDQSFDAMYNTIWISLLEICVWVAVFLLFIVCTSYSEVPSESMLPIIQKNSCIFFIRTEYTIRPYSEGDIVVFRPTITLYDFAGRRVESLVKRIDSLDLEVS